MNLQHRLFAFWDKSHKIETLVISTHGVIKKTDKVSQTDIDKAKAIMRVYFDNKTKNDKNGSK